jgi:uncharacterized membrane protein HdeD (DUF308 family)
MKGKKNLVLRCFGILLLITGIVLNIMMFIEKSWPTYLFFIICIVGLIQIIISFLVKPIKIIWQIFWGLLPFIIAFILLKD